MPAPSFEQQLADSANTILSRIRAKNEEEAMQSQFINAPLSHAVAPSAANNIWIAAPPPTFADFCEHELNLTLFPRQRAAIENSIGNDPSLVFHPRPTKKEWEAGQLTGQEPIRDMVQIVTLLWGKGAGKDILIAALLSWLVYIVINMRDPWAYFSHKLGSSFDIINVAKNAEQASGVFFNYLTQNLAMPCFKPFGGKLNKTTITYFRQLTGRSIPSPMLRLHSKHSEGQSFEGYNVLAFIMDEASSFELRGRAETAKDEDDEEYAVSPADHLFDILSSSAKTRFPRQYLGFIISYPRSEKDFTMRYYELSQRTVTLSNGKVVPEYPSLYGDRAATWDVRPDRGRDYFDEDYQRNPVRAAMMFECIPPPVTGGFFPHPVLIDEMFDPTLEPAVFWRSSYTNQGGQKRVALALQRFNFSAQHHYVAHFDAGISHDAFTLVIAHPNWLNQKKLLGANNTEHFIPEVVIDAVLIWRPDQLNHIVVDLMNASQVILDIANRCHFRKVSADRWNSPFIQQQLVSANIPFNFDGYTNAQQFAHYENLKDLIHGKLLRVAGSMDESHLKRLRNELRELQLINGRRVDHTSSSSKDLADALAGACHLACDPALVTRTFDDYATAATPQSRVEAVAARLTEQKKRSAAPTFRQVANRWRLL
jgi:hypothetical protein